MANRTWLRLYTEITRDRKLRRLDPACRWVWIAVLCIAKESPVPGKLLISENIPATVEDIADEAAVTVEEVNLAIQKFKEQRMIHEEDGVFVVTNWEKRQYSSDSSTERVRKHRQKKNETLQKRFSNVSVTPPDTDTESDSESDPENNLDSGFNRDLGTNNESEWKKGEGKCEGEGEKTKNARASRSPHSHSSSDNPQPQKIKYAEYVSMTEKEYQSLVDRFGEEDTRRMIEILDNYKGAKGKRYKSDYRAILMWVVDKLEEEKAKRARAPDKRARSPDDNRIPRAYASLMQWAERKEEELSDP